MANANKYADVETTNTIANTQTDITFGLSYLPIGDIILVTRKENNCNGTWMNYIELTIVWMSLLNPLRAVARNQVENTSIPIRGF